MAVGICGAGGVRVGRGPAGGAGAVGVALPGGVHSGVGVAVAGTAPGQAAVAVTVAARVAVWFALLVAACSLLAMLNAPAHRPRRGTAVAQDSYPVSSVAVMLEDTG